MTDRDEKSTPEFRNDAKLPPPPFPGSHMVLDDNYVFVSGLVAADIVDPNHPAMGDVAAETQLVLDELRRMLETAGCGMNRVVRADVHLADLDDIEVMNKVYSEFFQAGRRPARTCTESPRLFGGSRVEITLLARRT